MSNLTKSIKIRDISIGAGAPISIQSMTNTDTRDVRSTLRQIEELQDVGCQIIRLAVNNMDAAEAFGEIRKKTEMPLVADIHFDYRLAIAAIKNGADKIRINPGNIGSQDRVKAVVDAAKERGVPIRVGINGGSLEKEIWQKYGGVTSEGIVESALNNIALVEKFGFNDIVVSVKSSNINMNIEGYRLLSKQTTYPLHIGLTEAGYSLKGIVKSSVAMGSLLLDGIGDTLRVSLTGNPVEEIPVAKEILFASGSIKAEVDIISCPTCGRTHGDLEKYVKILGARSKELEGKGNITVAVMGCEVNGPGEAREATYGAAFGKGIALLFKKGEPVMKVKEEHAIDKLIEMIKED